MAQILRFRRVWTHHAAQRVDQRRIPLADIEAAFTWGRSIHGRYGKSLLFVGRREVARAEKEGRDIRSAEGLILITGSDGQLITAFRDRSLAAVGRFRRYLDGPRRRRAKQLQTRRAGVRS